MKYFHKTARAVNGLCIVVAGVAMTGMMLITCANIIARIFGGSVPGAYELTAMFAALSASLALAYTQLKKDNISVGLLQERMPAAARLVTSALNSLLCLALSSIACWQIFLYAGKIRLSGEVTETLHIPFHGFIYAVSAGFLLLSVVFALDLLALFVKEKPANPSDCEKEFELDDYEETKA